ncbi:MAG: hypothetical protein NC548_10620 [Lachnospiraceae bacterium]|nr:hypothetical protein [Lachnospiraceae bacterium]
MIEITEDMYNGRMYNGSESKCGVTIDRVNYILKRQKSDWMNVYCEFVVSDVIEALGGDVHHTLLAIEHGSVVVLCKDFTYERGMLQSLNVITESSIDTDTSRHDYFVRDVMHVIDCLKHADIPNIKEKFWQMYVFDSLFGNFDRHQ